MLFYFTIFTTITEVLLLNNGLARTPPMGWMSWGYYRCQVNCSLNQDCLNEELILSVADEFYLNGYQEAGYEYIIIDDCWSLKSGRDYNGVLVPDPDRFPNGMKYIADYIHARGLKFGLYSSAGVHTCEGYPGSRNYLKTDADTFASWDVDYVKFDGCFVNEEYLNTVYIDFGKYLNLTGRPMVYSCSWPYYIQYIHKHEPNYTAVSEHCNLWRNYHDIFNFWGSMRNIIIHYTLNNFELSKYAGPGRWNDPDMIIIGNGNLTTGQKRMQMSVFAVISAPLIFSTDLKILSQTDKEILLNPILIAIAQDPLGLEAVVYRLHESDIVLWVKKHLPRKGDHYHSTSFLFVNMYNDARRGIISPKLYGLNSTDGYVVLDVFSKKDIMNITLNDKLTVFVPPEGHVKSVSALLIFTCVKEVTNLGPLSAATGLLPFLFEMNKWQKVDIPVSLATPQGINAVCDILYFIPVIAWQYGSIIAGNNWN